MVRWLLLFTFSLFAGLATADQFSSRAASFIRDLSSKDPLDAVEELLAEVQNYLDIAPKEDLHATILEMHEALESDLQSQQTLHKELAVEELNRFHADLSACSKGTIVLAFESQKAKHRHCRSMESALLFELRRCENSEGNECHKLLKDHRKHKDDCDRLQEELDDTACLINTRDFRRHSCDHRHACEAQVIADFETAKGTIMANTRDLVHHTAAMDHLSCSLKALKHTDSHAALKECKASKSHRSSLNDHLSLFEADLPSTPKFSAGCDATSLHVMNQVPSMIDYSDLPFHAPAKTCISRCCNAAFLETGGPQDGIGFAFSEVFRTYPEGKTFTITESDFNKRFSKLQVPMVKRQCASCASTHTEILYKRVVNPPSSVSMYKTLTANWTQDQGLLGDDFNLYSTFADAASEKNGWKFCTYPGRGTAFPGNCGPTGPVENQFNSLSPQNVGKPAAFWMYEPSLPSKWSVGLTINPFGNITTPIRREEFNRRFQESRYHIVMRNCSNCIPSHQTIYFREITNVALEDQTVADIDKPTDILNLLACDWKDEKYVLNVNFKIYSSLDNALLDVNSWKSCPFNHTKNGTVGFPGDCVPNPSFPVRDQFTSIPMRGCAGRITGKAVTFSLLEDAVKEEKERKEVELMKAQLDADRRIAEANKKAAADKAAALAAAQAKADAAVAAAKAAAEKEIAAREKAASDKAMKELAAADKAIADELAKQLQVVVGQGEAALNASKAQLERRLKLQQSLEDSKLKAAQAIAKARDDAVAQVAAQQKAAQDKAEADFKAARDKVAAGAAAKLAQLEAEKQANMTKMEEERKAFELKTAADNAAKLLAARTQFEREALNREKAAKDKADRDVAAAAKAAADITAAKTKEFQDAAAREIAAAQEKANRAIQAAQTEAAGNKERMDKLVQAARDEAARQEADAKAKAAQAVAAAEKLSADAVKNSQAAQAEAAKKLAAAQTQVNAQTQQQLAQIAAATAAQREVINQQASDRIKQSQDQAKAQLDAARTRAMQDERPKCASFTGCPSGFELVSNAIGVTGTSVAECCTKIVIEASNNINFVGDPHFTQTMQNSNSDPIDPNYYWVYRDNRQMVQGDFGPVRPAVTMGVAFSGSVYKGNILRVCPASDNLWLVFWNGVQQTGDQFENKEIGIKCLGIRANKIRCELPLGEVYEGFARNHWRPQNTRCGRGWSDNYMTIGRPKGAGQSGFAVNSRTGFIVDQRFNFFERNMISMADLTAAAALVEDESKQPQLRKDVDSPSCAPVMLEWVTKTCRKNMEDGARKEGGSVDWTTSTNKDLLRGCIFDLCATRNTDFALDVEASVDEKMFQDKQNTKIFYKLLKDGTTCPDGYVQATATSATETAAISATQAGDPKALVCQPKRRIYQINNQLAKAVDARTKGCGEAMQLAMPKTRDEIKLLTSTVTGYVDNSKPTLAWLGAKLVKSEWVWDDGSKVINLPTDTSPFSNGNFLCMNTYSGQWETCRDSVTLGVICESKFFAPLPGVTTA